VTVTYKQMLLAMMPKEMDRKERSELRKILAARCTVEVVTVNNWFCGAEPKEAARPVIFAMYQEEQKKKADRAKKSASMDHCSKKQEGDWSIK